ncbi:hypothetical protein JW964_27675 [candidate division KSB1 bacterium]|nr:hypothetical protein [candidate division KSB1 bacterium]
MLFWIYIAIVLFLTIIILNELFNEKDWRKQIALAMLLIVFILRILQIK